MKDWSSEYINEYLSKTFDGKLVCEVTENKGRIVRASRSFKVGDVIFEERPLHIVTAAEDNEAFKLVKKLCKKDPGNFNQEPLWYWAALSSLTQDDVGPGPQKGHLPTVTPETQRRLLCLYHEEPPTASVASETLARELRLAAPALLVEELLRAWILNCFDHSEDPDGYVAYFGASFMSHSCHPNAIWHMAEGDTFSDTFVLRARRNIEAGDEMCIAYMSEQALLQAAATRRRELQSSKHFVCTCERCGPGAAEPDLCRGFRCPACGEGTVFHPGPIQGEELAAAVCKSCGECVGEVEAKRLLDAEAQLSKKLTSIEKSKKLAKKLVSIEDRCQRREIRRVLTEPEVQRLLRLIGHSAAGAVGPQHWLCEKLWVHLSEWYAVTGREEEACRVLRCCTEYQRSAFQGLNGAVAWTLERHADVLLREAGLPDISTRAQGLDGAAVHRIADRARQLYSEAVDILQPMFGETHEYVTNIAVKKNKVLAYLEDGKWPKSTKRKRGTV